MRNVFFFLIVLSVISSKITFASNQKPPAIVVSFMAKGGSMATDIGVIKALHEYLVSREGKDITENQIQFLFAGSSSGSILATYFACYGINQISIEYIIEQALKFPKEFVSEETTKKVLQVVLGINPEISIETLKPIRDLATGSNQCRPKLPLLTVAANSDIVPENDGLDGRIVGRLGGKNDKKTDVDSATLLTQSGKPLQKICTYLVNQSMADFIHTIDPKERKCDLRQQTNNDLSDEFFVIPSVSEPTYYQKFREKFLNLVESIYPLPTERSYFGGWVDLNPIQDIVRSLASSDIATWTFGTGRAPFERSQEAFIRNWFYGFSLNTNLLLNWHWLSHEVVFSEADWESIGEKNITPTKQIEIGYRAAKNCLREDNGCFTKLSLKPKYDYDAKKRPIVVKKGFY